MNKQVKMKVLAGVALAGAVMGASPAYAGGFLADLGQALGVITPAQAVAADQAWAGVKSQVPGLNAAEGALSQTVRGAAVGAATAYIGPWAPAVGNALVDNVVRPGLDSQRAAAMQRSIQPAPSYAPVVRPQVMPGMVPAAPRYGMPSGGSVGSPWGGPAYGNAPQYGGAAYGSAYGPQYGVPSNGYRGDRGFARTPQYGAYAQSGYAQPTPYQRGYYPYSR